MRACPLRRARARASVSLTSCSSSQRVHRRRQRRSSQSMLSYAKHLVRRPDTLPSSLLTFPPISLALPPSPCSTTTESVALPSSCGFESSQTDASEPYFPPGHRALRGSLIRPLCLRPRVFPVPRSRSGRSRAHFALTVHSQGLIFVSCLRSTDGEPPSTSPASSRARASLLRCVDRAFSNVSNRRIGHELTLAAGVTTSSPATSTISLPRCLFARDRRSLTSDAVWEVRE